MLFCFYGDNSIPFLPESQTITFDINAKIHLYPHLSENKGYQFFLYVGKGNIYQSLLQMHIAPETYFGKKVMSDERKVSLRDNPVLCRLRRRASGASDYNIIIAARRYLLKLLPVTCRPSPAISSNATASQAQPFLTPLPQTHRERARVVARDDE